MANGNFTGLGFSERVTILTVPLDTQLKLDIQREFLKRQEGQRTFLG